MRRNVATHSGIAERGNALREWGPKAMVRSEMNEGNPTDHRQLLVPAALPKQANKVTCGSALRERQRVEGAWRSGNACR